MLLQRVSFFLVQFALLAKRRIWEHWDICLAQTQQNRSLYRAEPTCILFPGDILGDSSSLRGLPLVTQLEHAWVHTCQTGSVPRSGPKWKRNPSLYCTGLTEKRRNELNWKAIKDGKKGTFDDRVLWKSATLTHTVFTHRHRVRDLSIGAWIKIQFGLRSPRIYQRAGWFSETTEICTVSTHLSHMCCIFWQ